MFSLLHVNFPLVATARLVVVSLECNHWVSSCKEWSILQMSVNKLCLLTVPGERAKDLNEHENYRTMQPIYL